MVHRSDCRCFPYSMHFSELMPNFFLRENGQNTKILKSTILQGAQSIDSERFFKVKGRNEEER